MSGFVSRPASSPAGSPHLVENDGWFPAIDLELLRVETRLDTTVTPARLREAAVSAMIDANRELAAWRAAQIAAGHDSLVEVPGPSVGGEPVKVSIYRRAVHSLVAADVLDRQPDITAVRAGVDREAELQLPADDHRRNYRWAIADLQDLGRTVVELI